jgi:hypothetical protein
MSKERLTRAEIEHACLRELRKVGGCGEATSVTIYPVADQRLENTWCVSHCNSGRSDAKLCARGLALIEPRLQARYDLADAD